MKMLVLQRVGALKGKGTLVSGGKKVKAVVADVSPKEARSLQRDPNVLGATEPMPVKLIEPVSAPTSSYRLRQGIRSLGASKPSARPRRILTGRE